MTNSLRMPFAEWLARMAERDLAPPGRTIAIYAAVFDITGNDQLAQLTGIHGRSLDKWKKALLSDGWVIIEGKIGGRGHGIHVSAALNEVPVSFTDVKPKKGSKYYPRNFRQSSAEIAGDIDTETPAEIAEPPQKLPPFSETPAENTGVNPATHSGVYNNYARGEDINIYNKNNTPRSEQEPAGARDGETEIASGLFKNCSTFRHRNFVIDVPALEYAVFGKSIPRERVVAFAEAQARQWAAEIANGKPPSQVVPQAIGRALAIGLTREANAEEAHRYGMDTRRPKGRSSLADGQWIDDIVKGGR